MNTINRKDISEALKEAMNKEDLHTRAAAKALNLNPCYISMAQNPKFWNSMSKTAQARVEEWFFTRGTLAQFETPEGEEIWKPKEKEYKPSQFIAGIDDPMAELLTKKDKEAKIPKLTQKEKIVKQIQEVPLTCDAATDMLKARADIREPEPGKTSEPVQLAKNKIEPKPEQYFTDAVRLKVALDIEINLVVNGQKVHL